LDVVIKGDLEQSELSWFERGACRGRGPDSWYVVDESDPDESRETPQRYERAVSICDVCVVKTACLDYALEHRECCGMWGGKTRSQRFSIIRRRRKAAKKAAKIEFAETAPGVFEIR